MNNLDYMIDELARKIDYPSPKRDMLALAMDVAKSNNNSKQKTKNDALSTVGDSLLRAIIVIDMYNDSISKQELTDALEKLENNKNQSKLFSRFNLIQYAHKGDTMFEDLPEENLPTTKTEHFPYLEAIIGAMYFDVGYDVTHKWVTQYLLPQLEKLANENE